jgi:2-iminobutanoate/2-iminopropanoate deaminase
METRKNFNTSRVPRITEVFPQAVIADKFIFISGTPGLNPATGKLSKDNCIYGFRKRLRCIE